jgi:hypothetical protein
VLARNRIHGQYRYLAADPRQPGTQRRGLERAGGARRAADSGHICGRLVADRPRRRPQIATFLRANAAKPGPAKRLAAGRKSGTLRTRCDQWTRTQRIRTVATIPVEAVIVDQTEVPVYFRIAERAKHLRVLGMSDKAIARALGVSDKTIAKAIRSPSAGPLR